MQPTTDESAPAAVAARYTAFAGTRRLRAGNLADVVLAAKAALECSAAGPVLIYDDATGAVVDVDTRGTRQEVRARFASAAAAPASSEEARGRGRPKLGVVAREVTLLPRHWEWLNARPGGASVALRKLVEAARREGHGADLRRERGEAAYRFMSAMAGDLPGFEEAARALFAGDRERLENLLAAWPKDVRDYARRLAFGPDTHEIFAVREHPGSVSA